MLEMWRTGRDRAQMFLQYENRKRESQLKSLLQTKKYERRSIGENPDGKGRRKGASLRERQ